MNVPFVKPYITGNELVYMRDLIENGKDLAGDGTYTKKAHEYLERRFDIHKALLTTSGTTALELAVRLLNLSPGDEVITPSFTFSSTANAILLANGVSVKFVDIEPSTLNMDLVALDAAITPKTKAVMAVHYAGISCDMDTLMAIAKRRNLAVIEDAAQAIGSRYKGKYLGTFGSFGCVSFHGTKNITCGEGGALFINAHDAAVSEKAEILREKGTNRSKFLRGLVDKYTWVDIGGSYLPSDLLAAFLYAQLESMDHILSLRRARYEYYTASLKPLADTGAFRLPHIPEGVDHNSHIFYIVLPDESRRNAVMDYLRKHGIAAAFHYVPLHSSPFGQSLGFDPSSLPVTTDMSRQLLRLPLYSQLSQAEQDYVIETLGKALKET